LLVLHRRTIFINISVKNYTSELVKDVCSSVFWHSIQPKILLVSGKYIIYSSYNYYICYMNIQRIGLRLSVMIFAAFLSACVHVDSDINITSTASYPLPNQVGLVVASEATDLDPKILPELAECVTDAATARGLDMQARAYSGGIEPTLKSFSDQSLRQELMRDGINWIHVMHAEEIKNTESDIGGADVMIGTEVKYNRFVTLIDTVMVHPGELETIGDISVSGDSSGGSLFGLAIIIPVVGIMPRMPVDGKLCEEFGNTVVDFHLDAQMPQPPPVIVPDRRIYHP
jgi:hypothetical protein